MHLCFIGKTSQKKIGNGDLSNAKVFVAEEPKYGTLTRIQPKPSDAVTLGGPGYSYKVKPGTPNGTEDRIVFLIEIAGKRLKVVERLIMVWNSTPESTDCNGKDFYVKRISQVLSSPDQNFAGVITDGVPNAYSLLAAGYYSGIRYSFTDLPATALGQTTGEGASATITLDQNAAGHGWYIDPTPLDSSDDYLPTATPKSGKPRRAVQPQARWIFSQCCSTKGSRVRSCKAIFIIIISLSHGLNNPFWFSQLD